MLKVHPIAYAIALVGSLAAVVLAWKFSPGPGGAAVTGLASTVIMGILSSAKNDAADEDTKP